MLNTSENFLTTILPRSRGTTLPYVIDERYLQYQPPVKKQRP